MDIHVSNTPLGILCMPNFNIYIYILLHIPLKNNNIILYAFNSYFINTSQSINK